MAKMSARFRRAVAVETTEGGHFVFKDATRLLYLLRLCAGRGAAQHLHYAYGGSGDC